jgi:hypothetical protein
MISKSLHPSGNRLFKDSSKINNKGESTHRVSIKRNSNFYLDITNLWKTNQLNQEKQYEALKRSELFSQ